LRLTNQYHGLIYQSSWVEYSHGHQILAFKEGAWYYVHVIYVNISCALGAFIYLRFYLKAAPFYRRQILAMVVASLIPWSTYMIYLVWHDLPKLDLTPFAITISAPIWAIGIFRYQLMNLAPIARDSIFENMADGVMVLDFEDRLIDYNPAARKIIPELNKFLIGYNPQAALRNYPEVESLIKSSQEDQVDIKTVHDGHTAFYRTSLIQLSGKKGRNLGRMISFNNITEQVKLMQKLEVMASIDELTGIYNRRYLLSLSKVEVSRAKRHGLPISLLLMDLDHFKKVNDQYGHALGDKVLKEVAQVILRNIREIDVFGRYGGEEFAVVLPDTLPAKAREVADRLCLAIYRHSIYHQNNSINITASFGVAGSLNMHEGSLRSLLNNADQALYQAKAGGRNQVVLYTA
jgi:diguanylate cyclase (GGDEF)-like protein